MPDLLTILAYLLIGFCGGVCGALVVLYVRRRQER